MPNRKPKNPRTRLAAMHFFNDHGTWHAMENRDYAEGCKNGQKTSDGFIKIMRLPVDND